MLLHGCYDSFPGGHGWTTDPAGIEGWEFSASPAYGFEVNLEGSLTTLGQRERPQVVQQEGVLTHLFNGAGRKGSTHTFSMVTEVCQHGPPVWKNGVPTCE